MPNSKSYRELHDRVARRPGAAERLAALRQDTLAEIGLYELRRSLERSQADLATELEITQPASDHGHAMVITSRVKEEPMPQTQDPLPETMPAGEFKAKCLAIMDQVAKTGGQVIITKYGHPVAALVPCPPPPAEMPELWGSCRGEITVNVDLTEPIGAEEDWIGEWEAEWDEFLPESPGSAGSDTAPAS